jgi:hypothetical protein
MLTAGTGEAQAIEGRLYNLSDGARDRTYLLYRPENLSRQIPAPLVIVLHGSFGSGQQAENHTTGMGKQIGTALLSLTPMASTEVGTLAASVAASLCVTMSMTLALLRI